LTSGSFCAFFFYRSENISFLAIRDGRREIDVVLDKVNDELHAEAQLIVKIKAILAQVRFC